MSNKNVREIGQKVNERRTILWIIKSQKGKHLNKGLTSKFSSSFKRGNQTQSVWMQPEEGGGHRKTGREGKCAEGKQNGPVCLAAEGVSRETGKGGRTTQRRCQQHTDTVQSLH